MLGIYLALRAKTEYYLRIMTEEGESRIIRTLDRDYVESICQAMNEAIALKD
ncbi:MAG: hypothetical protein GTO18_19460 [Anaerolineales bacterium]|nr:hypothetical protein [Anaerolineales bacterium]